MSSAVNNSQTKLNELFDAIRQEFVSVSQEANTYRLQNQKDYDYKINQHLAEMQQIRNTVYELELSHRKMKDTYEEEINRLNLELSQRDQQIAGLTQQQSIQQQQQQQQQHHQQQGNLPNQSNGPALAPLISAIGSQIRGPQINGTNQPPQIQQQQPPQPPIVGSGKINNGSQLPQLPQQPPQNGINQQLPPPPQQPQQLPQLPPQQQPAQPSQPAQQPQPLQGNVEALQQQNNQNLKQTEAQLDATATTGASASPANTTTQPAAAVAPLTTTATPVQAPIASNTAATTGLAASTSPATATASATSAAVTTNADIKDEKKDDNYLVPFDQRASQLKAIPPFLLDLDYTQVPDRLKKKHDDFYVLYNPALPRNIEIDLHKSLDHSSVVCCVKFSNDGEFLATGCNKTTQVYKVSTGELVAKLSDDNAPSLQNNNDSNNNENGGSTDLYIRSVCFSPDGKFLATGAEDRLIRIWDIEKKEIIMVLQGHDQDVYSLDYFPSGDKLVSGSGDRTVRVWDLRTGQCSLTLSIEDGVTTVAVSPGDGKYIAAGSLDRAVRVWDSETGFLVERLDSENELGTGHRDSVYSVVFTRDGNKVVSGSLDRSVKLWNLRGSKEDGNDKRQNSAICDVTYIGHKDFVLSVTTTSNDEYILSGSKDRGVLFWDTKSGNPLLMLQGHKNSVISVAVSNGQPLGPQYQVFATGSGDCRARIWKFNKNNDGTPKIQELQG